MNDSVVVLAQDAFEKEGGTVFSGGFRSIRYLDSRFCSLLRP